MSIDLNRGSFDGYWVAGGLLAEGERGYSLVLAKGSNALGATPEHWTWNRKTKW